jgi:hypothetical protein
VFILVLRYAIEKFPEAAGRSTCAERCNPGHDSPAAVLYRSRVMLGRAVVSGAVS